ncbi:MAG TPA: LuxR C-terminal-related transcriptional regulator [Candidatus Limnocylindrales bacterium]|nr:LuxR C-terminal-related transcriptional regulator [Candidatus Limnocylindrales bacterium]
MVSFKAILRKIPGEPVRLPTRVGKHFAESDLSAPYLVSCLAQQAILYVSPKFEKITGYACQKFISEGLTFWFSVIHPADMQAVVGSITKAQHELLTINPRPMTPLKLEYRITRRDSRVIWIREFKQIISYRNGKKDHILGCLHDITAEKADERTAIEALLKRDKAANALLDIAVSHRLSDALDSRKSAVPSSNPISGREREVLRLVAAGYSSKQIAAELAISENTVETHRRHLLQKLHVNNSTALVKEAHRRCLV